MDERNRPRRDLCAQWHEDDGVNPRMERERPERKPGRKDLQLCGQVMEALNAALRMEVRSDVLAELMVASVEPMPDASRLRVTVEGPALRRLGVGKVMSELNKARGFLRMRVAGAITRKRVPELVFVPAAPEEVGDE